MTIFANIHNCFKLWRDRRFLRRHGCETWREYDIRYDTDVNRSASRVREFYHGYPYVYCFENRDHPVYYWDIAVDGAYILNNWCENTCVDKYRLDFHRVYRNYWNEWEINEIGGGDYIFAAFKNERDYLLFSLKWI